jgi:putative ABC transport system ATP-binding protein
VLELIGITRSVSLPDGQILEILRGVDLQVDQGEVLAILGRSGSGKSTLLNVLGLLDTPTAGSYRVGGRDVRELSDGERSVMRGERFGFVFQQFHLLEGRSALENAAAPLAHAGWTSYRTRRQRAAEVLTSVGLEGRLASRPHQLSGGEQQRVAIARALVRRPSVILADEPTGSLDTGNADVVLRLLLDLVRTVGSSLVLVTHDPVVADVADRRLQLDRGRLVAA